MELRRLELLTSSVGSRDFLIRCPSVCNSPARQSPLWLWLYLVYLILIHQSSNFHEDFRRGDSVTSWFRHIGTNTVWPTARIHIKIATLGALASGVQPTCSVEPLFWQAKDIVVRRRKPWSVQQAQITEKGSIKSPRALAREYGVSRETLRKVIVRNQDAIT